MTMLRKYLAWTWLAFFLFANVELHELFKLPGLWNHYQEHLKIAATELSFQAFLNMHYNEENPAEHPGHHHEKLPFKDESGCAHGISLAFLHGEEEIMLNSPLMKQPLHAKIPAFYPLSASKGIWQPPKWS